MLYGSALVSGTRLTEARSLDSMVHSHHSISLNLTSNLANKLQQISQQTVSADTIIIK